MNEKTKGWFEENILAHRDERRSVSQSAITDGLRCPRLFLYKHRWGIRPKVPPFQKSRSFGSMVHRLLQKGPDKTGEVRKELIRKHAKLIERIRNREDLTGDLAREAGVISENFQKALAVVSIFWERFPLKNYIVPIAVERKFTTVTDPLPEVMTITGIIDVLFQDSRTGKYWIRDYKTTSQPFDTVVKGYDYSIQALIYRFLIERFLATEKRLSTTENNVVGIILDLIKTPSIKQCGTDEKNAREWKCTPFEAYVRRIKEWYEIQGVESMTSKALPFVQGIMTDDLRQVLKEIYRFQTVEPTPCNFRRDVTKSRCHEYRSECPYYSLCSTDAAAWPSLIERFYEVEKDDDDDVERKEERKEEKNGR